jgi:hypothetical protein
MTTAITQEDVERLKTGWSKDPCWDVEETEGFEEFKEELLAWRKEQEAIAEERYLDLQAKRIKKVVNETGCDEEVALALSTFGEIDFEITRADEEGGNKAQIAHAKATLLLAAQVKRVADVLEAINEREDSNDSRLLLDEKSVRIWGTGGK